MAASTGIPSLFVLPPEILQLILHEYCRGKDLFSLSLALESSRSYRERSRSLIGAVLQKRLTHGVLLVHEDKEKWASCLEDEEQPSITNHIISRYCALVDYFEQLRHVLWCGTLEFHGNGLSETLRRANTVLRSPPCCTPVALSQWHTSFRHTSSCRPMIKLQARQYNFIPVPPYGQIMGATPNDQDIVNDIGRHLEAQNQVLTLSSPSQEEGFILRVISPAQARQRLGKFGTGYRPKDSWVVENPIEGLVCSWEYPPESDDDSNPLPTTKNVIRSILHVVKNWEQIS